MIVGETARLQTVARIFRLWEKKRGDRRTGSQLLGSFGEASFFALLFLLGSVFLAALVATWVMDPTPNLSTIGPGNWLLLLVLISFMAIGGGGLIYTVVQVGASAERRSALARKAAELELISDTAPKPKDYPNIPSDSNLTNSPGITLAYRLPIAGSSVWRLGAATAFCLVWNGITAVLLALAFNKLSAGRPEWFLSIALIPFLAVGGWSFYYLTKQLVTQTSVGPTSVEISDQPWWPGRRYDVFVVQAGRLSVKSLEMFLVCQEETTFRQGTDVRTEVRPVHRQSVFRREDFKIQPGLPFEHQSELQVPSHAMHSFHSSHNSVSWKLVVRGEVVTWPDFERSFPVIVYPSPNGAGGE